MTETGHKGLHDGVLRIAVSDPGRFSEGCAAACHDEAVRAVLILLSGGCTVAPGMPAELGAVEAPVVIGLSGAVDDRLLELALAADVRICSTDASFALTQPDRGELPSDGGTQRLPRIVGPGLAADMLLTGRRLDAGEALSAGLVSEIAGAELEKRAFETASGIAARGRSASRFTKEAVIKGDGMPLEQAVRMEADLAILLHTDPERAEGIAAFKARRTPRYWPDGR